MPTFQTLLPIRTLRSRLAIAALLWLTLLSCLSWPTTASAQAVNFEPPIYLHPDLNGNTVMASNAAGQIIWQDRLEPYGRKSVLSNSAVGGAGADQGFHGKTRDEETGLIYFGARHYHPLLGRFLSMDPVETQSDNLHSFNRYAFANNNPYKYTDPDGQIPLPIIAYYGVTALTPIVSGLAVRFAASRVVQFGLSVAAGEVGLAVPGAVVVGAGAAAKGLGSQNLLYKAATGQFKNSELSNAGRALTKHPELIGETKDSLRQALRTEEAINDAAHSALRDIMRNGVTTNPTLPRYGTVIQTQIPGGFGARWDSSGSFIGFINP